MKFNKLKLENFRCHKSISLEIPSTPFYITGKNGTGKTSLIEAIYLAYTLKTFRKSAITEIMTFKEKYLKIEISSNLGVIVYFYDTTRKILLNGKEQNTSFSFDTPVLCYSPSFDTALSEDKSDRRAFLDRVIYYNDKSHAEAVKNYNALITRKKAEIIAPKPNKKVLSILNERLSPLSDRISTARLALVKWLNEELLTDPIYELIFQGKLPYYSTNRISDDIEEEIKARKTLYGCHKDLLYLKMGGIIIDKFQSFGQKKSIILVILMHMAKRIEQLRKSGIILLLDDFEAGLDTARTNLLATLFLNKNEYDRQIILTGINASIGELSHVSYSL